MDPFTISIAVAPLILSSAKLTMLIRAVKDSYHNAPMTLIAMLMECRVMHITLSKIQGLVHKDETGLSSRLAAQEILREAFDDALTGCRMTLAALSLELGKLAEPKKSTKTTELSLQAKARLVWKEDIMKQLLDQTRGQLSSLHCLIELLESDTQAEILKLLKQNRADIRKVLHRAKTVRSEQGIDDDQSSFNFAHQSVDYGLAPSYEAQLSQSSTYQRAKTAAAEELLARKIELMDEKYALEERVENLLLDANLKDERISQLEVDILSTDKRVSKLKDYISKKDEEVSQLKDDVLLRDGRIASLENAISTKDECLLAKEKSIAELEDAMMQKDEVVDIQKETNIDWTADSMYTKAFNRVLEEEADIQADDRGKCLSLTPAAGLGHVKVGADIETRDRLGHLLLDLAESSDHIKGVETVLRKIANTEAATDGRWTHMVATHAEIIKNLLEDGANLEAEGKSKRTTLFAETKFGHVNLAKILLDKGANIEATDGCGRTPLHMATQFGHVGLANLLLEKGADIKAVDREGWTLLHIAARYGHADLAKLFLRKKANIEAVVLGGKTPLHVAAQFGYIDLAKIFLHNRASIEAANQFERTALHTAIEFGHIDLATMLLDKGANIEAVDRFEKTALHMAAGIGHIDLATMLVDKGASIEAADQFKRTALRIAAVFGCIHLATMLLDKGASIEAADYDERTALHMAAEFGHIDLATMLLDKGANMEATDKYGRTPLLKAAQFGHVGLANLLLEKGADINADRGGWKPLHIRARYGHADLAKLFLDKGSSIEAKDKYGRSHWL